MYHSYSDSNISSGHSSSGLLGCSMIPLDGRSCGDLLRNGKVMMTKSVSQPCLPTPKSASNSGIMLNEFQKVQVIGTGTFSKVYLVRRKDEYFAMKVVPKRKLQNLKQVNGIISEKDILLSINHPYIVKMHTTFQDAENLYMLMEFAPGGELFYHLRDSGTFKEDVTKFYAAEIILALEHLHGMGVVYRDLKLENLVLSASGDIRLTDFGFAKRLASKDQRTHSICGTAEYLAPELLLGRGYNFTVDWWALGVLVFEMMCGFSPFFDETPVDIYKKILNCKIDFPSSLSPHAKSFVKGLLRRDWTKRLGCGLGGAIEVKNHPWFEGYNWDSPTPPFAPPLSHNGDTSFFQVEIDENEFDHLDQDSKESIQRKRHSADGANEKIPDWFERF